MSILTLIIVVALIVTIAWLVMKVNIPKPLKTIVIIAMVILFVIILLHILGIVVI